MNRDYKTKAIILKKRGWRDADLLFSICTENYGKVEAMAQSVRKGKSKLAGHLATPGIVEINYVRGKAFFRLTHVFMAKRWQFNSDADFYFYCALMEIVEKTTREGDSNEKIWNLLVWACEHIFAAEKYSQKIFVLNVFIIKLLTHIGYEISSEQCGNCGETFEAVAKYDFSRNNFYCGKCARSGRALPQSAINIINATKKPQAICARMTNGEIYGLFDFLGDYLSFYIERKFNSLEIIKRCVFK